MTIRVLHERGCSSRSIARQLGIDERAVRYRLGHLRQGARDGRSGKAFRAAECAEAIDQWMTHHGGAGTNLAVLHDWLVTEHRYGSGKQAIVGIVVEAILAIAADRGEDRGFA